MIQILLNSVALEPNRWTSEKIAYFSLDALLEHVARAGFHFMEIWQYHISRSTELEIRQIQGMADSLGLTFPVIGMYPKLHLQGRERSAELDNIERLMNYAKYLEADIVKAFVGVHGSAQITDSEYKSSVECMQEILELADSYGLTITGETHPNTLFDSMDSCKKFKKDINSENLKICYQPFDFSNTEKVVHDYQVLSDDVIHVHYQGQKNGEMNLLADSDLDYKKLTTALVTHGFSGKICIEFVKDCVVNEPEDFEIEKVLENAILDRNFIVSIFEEIGATNLKY